MIIKQDTDSQYNSQYTDDDSLRNLFFLVAKFAKWRPKGQLNVVQILSLHIYNYNNCPNGLYDETDTPQYQNMYISILL